jgi:hypothetical protein
MNFYFREPSKDGKRKKPKKIRFPVHRFERERFRMYLFIILNFKI